MLVDLDPWTFAGLTTGMISLFLLASVICHALRRTVLWLNLATLCYASLISVLVLHDFVWAHPNGEVLPLLGLILIITALSETVHQRAARNRLWYWSLVDLLFLIYATLASGAIVVIV